MQFDGEMVDAVSVRILQHTHWVARWSATCVEGFSSDIYPSAP